MGISANLVVTAKERGWCHQYRPVQRRAAHLCNLVSFLTMELLLVVVNYHFNNDMLEGICDIFAVLFFFLLQKHRPDWVNQSKAGESIGEYSRSLNVELLPVF